MPVECGAERTAKVASMQFAVGQTVVHPQHGPSTVIQLVKRSIQGVSRSYVDLQVHRTDLRVSVPVEVAGDVGIRPPRTAGELAELWEVLREPTLHEEEQWSRRMKGNHEKLRLGDLLRIAEVVRDLTRRDETRGISAGEKDLLKHARQPIVVEVGVALGLSDEDAEALLDAEILGESQAVPTAS
jgi:CarD family transcriptional regulator